MLIPIALAFDNNLAFPACICISSLLMNANKDTFYDIYILHSEKENLVKTDLNKLPHYYKNCKIQYRTVGNEFDDAFEIRGITTPAYYRLIIPELIPEYDKIIYTDADLIFRMDLSELYSIDMGNNYLAATRDLGINLEDGGIKYINSIQELHLGDYIQSGFIMLNNKLIRENDIIDKFKLLSKNRLKFQDQDILNIVCYGHILFLPLEYNMTDYSFFYAIRERSKILNLFTESQICYAVTNGNIHYNGHKPWKKYCVNFDIWWEYYRRTPYFNTRFYFDFFYDKINELDKLPLLKRVKILLRYFFVNK